MLLPEIMVEDLLLVVASAALISLLIATIIRRTWRTIFLRKLPFLNIEKYNRLAQTVLVVGATYLIVIALWLLCSIPNVAEALHNNVLTTRIFSFQGIRFSFLLTLLVGWLVSASLHRLLSTEEKLRVSEERFRRVFEHSATGMMLVGPDGCFLGLNRAFCQMVGYEEMELAGLHFTEITYPDDRDICLNEIHKLVEGQTDPMILQKRYRRKNGEVIWASVIGAVVRDAAGRPLYLIGQVTDITQRRRTEEALQQSENKFRLLVEQSLVGVYIIQEEKFAYINPRFASIMGYSAEELLQMPSVMEVVAEADRPLVQEQIRRRISGEVLSAHYTFHSCRKDGDQIIVEVLGSRTELNGRPAVLGTVLDITQQKRADEALRATVEHTPNVSVQWYDEDGRVLFWNAASEKIFGWTATEVLGKTLSEFLLTPESNTGFRETLRHVAHSNQPASPREYVFTRRNGDKGWCVSTIFPIPSPDGQRRYVCMDVDITEQKRAETALHEISGQLLRLQDEEHRHIARELHDTTAQGLAALTMNLSYLQRSNPAQSGKFQTILAESLTLAERSLKEIRTLSYLLHPPELDAVGLPAAVREYAAGFARRSGIETRVEIAADLRRLPPDIELALFRIIQEALGNILSHACSPTAEISLQRTDHQLALHIRDQGRGIPPARLVEINSLRGSVGVGFAGMHERLRQLGGKLEVQSSDAGTTICAVVPLKP